MTKNIDNKVDAYLREYTTTDGENKCYMSFSYNGLDFAHLYKDQDARLFAIYYKWNYLQKNPDAYNHTFTDSEGNPSKKRDYTSVLSSIKGKEEIEEAMKVLIYACTRSNVQADLTVHYNDKEYPLVRDTDNEIYFPSDLLKVSKKGYSYGELKEFLNDINTIKENTKSTQIKKTSI